MVAAGFGGGTGGNMGHGFLKNFVVPFDWSTNTMYLDPLAEGDVVPVPRDPAGASLSLTDGGLVIGGIAEGFAADDAGIGIGDLVTAVDGGSVEGITTEQYCADIAGQTHNTVTTESGTFDVSPAAGFFDGLDN